MLQTIKDIINQQKSFQEAAELLLEDESLDDALTLDEAPEDEPDEKIDLDKETGRKGKDKDSEDDDEDIKDDLTEPDDDKTVEPGEKDDIDDTDNLPEPVGKQTGEPAQMGDEGLLDITIDISTNTQTDTLPIPPINAGDAIDGGSDSQFVDAGFGKSALDEPVDGEVDDEISAPEECGDSTSDIINEPIESESNEEDTGDLLSEAITVGAVPQPDPNQQQPEPAPAQPDQTQQQPTDQTQPDPNQPVDPNAQPEPAIDPNSPAATDDMMAEPADDGNTPPDDNLVTQAVKDKVNEMDTTDDVPVDSNANIKDSLLKKLGSLTKSLEDAKRTIMDKLQ